MIPYHWGPHEGQSTRRGQSSTRIAAPVSLEQHPATYLGGHQGLVGWWIGSQDICVHVSKDITFRNQWPPAKSIGRPIKVQKSDTKRKPSKSEVIHLSRTDQRLSPKNLLALTCMIKNFTQPLILK